MRQSGKMLLIYVMITKKYINHKPHLNRIESQTVEENTRNAVIASYDGSNNQVNNIPENLFIRRWDLTEGCQSRWYYKETTHPIGQVNKKL